MLTLTLMVATAIVAVAIVEWQARRDARADAAAAAERAAWRVQRDALPPRRSARRPLPPVAAPREVWSGDRERATRLGY